SILLNNDKRLIISTITISIILFILSTTVRITEFNDVYDYMISLPYLYWIGISFLIFSIILQLKFGLSKLYDIILIILTNLYADGITTIITEYPPFIDTYLHGAESFPIINRGYLSSSYNYSYGFPLAFIFMAISLLIQGIEPFTFFSIFSLLFMSISSVIVYLISNLLVGRFSLLSSVAFISFMFGHDLDFSPQMFTYVMYAMLLLFIFKFINKRDNKLLILSVLSIITINLTSPTNSFFVVINIAFLILLHLFYIRHINIRYFNILMLISILSLITIYVTNATYMINEYSRYGNELLEFSNIKVTPSPSPSYTYSVNLRIAFSIIILIITIIVIYSLRKMKREYTIVIGGGILLLYTILASLTSFIAAFLFLRIITYIAFLMPILFIYIYIQKRSRLLLFSFIILVISSLILLPITKHARNITAYATPSLYYGINTLVIHDYNKDRVISIVMPSFVSKYIMAINDNYIKPSTLSFNIANKLFDGVSKDEISQYIENEMLYKIQNFNIFADEDLLNLKHKYGLEEVYNNVEDTVSNNQNLLINTSNSRIYHHTVRLSQ
ncbi:MAG: hypothetical protein QXQ75_02000, partial [Candidatus Nitrosocaldaceae archaeon]